MHAKLGRAQLGLDLETGEVCEERRAGDGVQLWGRAVVHVAAENQLQVLGGTGPSCPEMIHEGRA